jgi:hypothetical protein
MSTDKLPPEDRRPALRPPQFGLAILLRVVAFLCAFLASIQIIGPIGAFALLLFVLLVVAHVSGNALGMRLRSYGDQPVDEEDRPLQREPRYRKNVAMAVEPSRLRERRRLGLLLTAIVTLATGLGAAGGVWWTLHERPGKTTVQDAALAAAAYGVLGGIGGLIGGGFVVVGIGAWREALQGARRTEPRV